MELGERANMAVRGWINSFGVFQAYYTDILDRSPSEVSWIGSLSVFLLFFVGTLTGRLTDAGFFRSVFATGTALLILGIFTTSVCHSYWQFLLAQGLCMGIACGCLFCPMLAVLATYFSRRRGLAMGVAACGGVVGGVTYPLVVRQLLPTVGFAWAVRTVGFIMLGTMTVANVLAKPRIKPRKTGPLVEWAAFKELEYTFYAAASFFVSFYLEGGYSDTNSGTELLGCLLCVLLHCRVFEGGHQPASHIHGLTKPPPHHERREPHWTPHASVARRPCRRHQCLHTLQCHLSPARLQLDRGGLSSGALWLGSDIRNLGGRHPELV